MEWISNNSFLNCSSLTEISIPKSLESIGENAFSGCTALKKVIVKDISAWCGVTFNGLESNPLHYAHHLYSDEETEIKELMLVFCHRGSSYYPCIKKYAFYDAEGLEKIYILCGDPGVPYIQDDSFGNTCYTWTDLYVESGRTNYQNDNNWKKFKSISEYRIIFDNIDYKPTKLSGSFGLRAVGNKDCSGDLVIPESVTFMGQEFDVVEIDGFQDCTNLTSIHLPSSLKVIGSYAFRGCTGLSSIDIPNSVSRIEWCAFRGCSSLTSIVIPNNLTTIEDGTFQDCRSLTSMIIPNSVTSIGEIAFYGCSDLTSITIPNSVTNIENSAFSGCSGLTKVYCNAEKVPTTSADAFQNANISKATLIVPGSSVSAYTATSPWSGFGTIKDNGIYSGSCGDNVNYSLDTSTGLLSITGTGAMTNYSSSSAPWYSNKSYIKTVEISDGVTSIGQSAFDNCMALTSVIIPNSVTSIDNYAFFGCTSLTSVTIPNSVQTIGESAFGASRGLSSVSIGNSVTSIGYGAFDLCDGLTSVTIPNSVTSIGQNAFRSCSSLTSVIIPNSVTSIGQAAFRACTGLTSVTIGSSVTSIGSWVFDECKCLKSIYSMIENPFAVYELLPSQNKGVTLYVPTGTIDKYKSTAGWKDFKYIVEFDPTGITSVTSDKENPNAPIYDLNGRRLTELQKGINIIGGKKVLIH